MLCLVSRSIQFAPNEYYHVYNRGIERRLIFMDSADYKRFIALIYIANNTEPVHIQLQGRTLKSLLDRRRIETLVEIIAYCLMPNHFHLLVHEKETGGISKFMQKLSTGYTMYFNTRYERSGSLFQGKFKATHIEDDRYLRYLFSYIHLNPAKLIQSDWKEVGIKNMERVLAYLEEYPYSSFLDYKGTIRPENKILDIGIAPEYFNSIPEMDAEIQEWLHFKVEP